MEPWGPALGRLTHGGDGQGAVRSSLGSPTLSMTFIPQSRAGPIHLAVLTPHRTAKPQGAPAGAESQMHKGQQRQRLRGDLFTVVGGKVSALASFL